MKSYSEFCSELIHAVYITDSAAATPAGRRAADRAESEWPGVIERIASRDSVPRRHHNQQTIVIDEVRGAPFGTCPGSNGHRCCNYHTVDLYLGCSIGCTYCIMNGYLNYTPLVVQADTEPIITAIRSAAGANPDQPMRVGSGEVGDSLLLDPVFQLNEEIIRGLSDLPNVQYETKTKTNYVDHLLEIHPKGNAVISFSLNPDAIIAAEEGLAATVDERLDAADRCIAAGYHVAFHFDPIIRTQAFPNDYLQLISRLSLFPPDAISWISLGTIRYPPALKDAFADRPFASEEFVPTGDGELRYLQPVRARIYATLRAALAESTSAPLYMCMESPAMWNRVFGGPPELLPELRDIFVATDRLKSR